MRWIFYSAIWLGCCSATGPVFGEFNDQPQIHSPRLAAHQALAHGARATFRGCERGHLHERDHASCDTARLSVRPVLNTELAPVGARLCCERTQRTSCSDSRFSVRGSDCRQRNCRRDISKCDEGGRRGVVRKDRDVSRSKSVRRDGVAGESERSKEVRRDRRVEVTCEDGRCRQR